MRGQPRTNLTKLSENDDRMVMPIADTCRILTSDNTIEIPYFKDLGSEVVIFKRKGPWARHSRRPSSSKADGFQAERASICPRFLYAGSDGAGP